jgi:hypothetical protein
MASCPEQAADYRLPALSAAQQLINSISRSNILELLPKYLHPALSKSTNSVMVASLVSLSTRPPTVAFVFTGSPVDV